LDVSIIAVECEIFMMLMFGTQNMSAVSSGQPGGASMHDSGLTQQALNQKQAGETIAS
jgi:hypothetical protein